MRPPLFSILEPNAPTPLSLSIEPGIDDGSASIFLAISPGPADIEQVVFLSYIAVKLRNGKVHSSEYTSARAACDSRGSLF
jgi:hypothetical protein